VYPLLAIPGGSRYKASLVIWLAWVVLLSAWSRVCIVEPFGVVSAVLAFSSIKPIHLPGCILKKIPLTRDQEAFEGFEYLYPDVEKWPRRGRV
jgi:hypothetical protein